MAENNAAQLTVYVHRAGLMASEEGGTWQREAGSTAAEVNGQNLSEAHVWFSEEYAQLYALSLPKPGLRTQALLPPGTSGPCPSRQRPIHPAPPCIPVLLFSVPLLGNDAQGTSPTLDRASGQHR